MVSSKKELIQVIFELKSGKIVKSKLNKKQMRFLENGKGLSSDRWYDGPSTLGTWSEYCCFDGTQIVKWKKL